MQTMMASVAVYQVFIALADSTRRSLLEQIAAQPNGLTATQLAHNASISRQAIAKHLNILNDAGVIAREKAGREVRYKVATSQIAATGRWMQRMAERWAEEPPNQNPAHERI